MNLCAVLVIQEAEASQDNRERMSSVACSAPATTTPNNTCPFTTNECASMPQCVPTPTANPTHVHTSPSDMPKPTTALITTPNASNMCGSTTLLTNHNMNRYPKGEPLSHMMHTQTDKDNVMYCQSTSFNWAANVNELLGPIPIFIDHDQTHTHSQACKKCTVTLPKHDVVTLSCSCSLFVLSLYQMMWHSMHAPPQWMCPPCPMHGPLTHLPNAPCPLLPHLRYLLSALPPQSYMTCMSHESA